MAVISDLLAPSVVTGIVSRIAAPGNVLQRMFGMEIGGRNINRVSGRAYSWDIFDNARTVAVGRAPGTGPAAVALNPVGRMAGTFPRTYEKGIVAYELLANLRKIGANAGERDQMGASYLKVQAEYMKLRTNNFRELMLAGVLTQGGFNLIYSGDNWYPTFAALGSNPGVAVPFQIPSGNIGVQNGAFAANLNPTGAGNIISAAWSNTATDIPTQLDQINQAFQNLTNAPLGVAITNSTVWRFLLKNTQVQNQAGTASTGYLDYDRENVNNENGVWTGLFKARLKAIPWLEWWIYDGGLEAPGLPNGAGGSFVASYAPFYPTTQCLVSFLAAPYQSYLQMMEGSEPVKDNPMAPAIERYGSWFWLREWDEPAKVELHGLCNAIPQLQIPKAIMIGQVS